MIVSVPDADNDKDLFDVPDDDPLGDNTWSRLSASESRILFNLCYFLCYL